jgi:cyclase
VGAAPCNILAMYLNWLVPDAALAASIFHFKEVGIMDLKEYLKEQQVVVRL